MTTVPLWLGGVSLGILAWIYGGYAVTMIALARLLGRRQGHPRAGSDGDARSPDDALPSVTVHIAMFNEVARVPTRLDDLVAQPYPRDRYEVLVISDGSTDGTAEAARAYAERHLAEGGDTTIRVVEVVPNRGKANAQNVAAEVASGDMLVSTDADATFGPGTVRALVEAASRDGVAAAGGELEFRSGPTGFSLGQRAYRWLEHRLRSAESALGVCVRTDATCTAYRKSLWEPIEEFEDLDQSFPFVARRAGLRVVIADGAKVTDEPNVTARQELRARARMTRKTLLSFRRRWGLRDALRHPGFTLAFVNHKLVRFLSPVAVAGVLVALTWAGDLPLRIGLAFLLLASIALPRVFPFSLLHAFLVANAGFALGVVQWFTGDRSGSIR